MRRTFEGCGFHTLTEVDLAAEKALSILNEQMLPICSSDQSVVFHGLALQEHLDGAEDALSMGKMDTFKKHVESAHFERRMAKEIIGA